MTTDATVRSTPRTPRRLLLALFGEHVLDHYDAPIRTGVLISVLEQAGIAAPATRATLDRLSRSGFLASERRGRELLFRLTTVGEDVLREATDRVRGPRPFDPHGEGWTLVTFSIPERQRRVRHRLRASLSWEGFAPIRDGLWLAPGEVDMEASLEPMRADLPDGALVAFHARELAGFPIAESVRAAWDIEAIRTAHLGFIDEWSREDAAVGPGPLATITMLVADWLALLRADPRLPSQYMGADWPATRSLKVYRRRRDELAASAEAEFATLIAEREPAQAAGNGQPV
ncbi:PadR family transcriptional regulator [Microbacterium lacus]|uniref:PaaX family transcriptional regulator n=1 Tax=Microbacterium lacus TaxID=415217 RepID=UPI00385107D6